MYDAHIPTIISIGWPINRPITKKNNNSFFGLKSSWTFFVFPLIPTMTPKIGLVWVGYK